MNNVAFNLIAISKQTQIAAEIAFAEIVFDLLPEDFRADLGTTDLFGETINKVDIVKRAVVEAQKQGEPFKYGAPAKLLFAMPE